MAFKLFIANPYVQVIPVFQIFCSNCRKHFNYAWGRAYCPNCAKNDLQIPLTIEKLKEVVRK